MVVMEYIESDILPGPIQRASRAHKDELVKAVGALHDHDG